MKPGARLSSVLELLEQAFTTDQPFDISVAHYFRSRRYAGSQDRRTILEIVYGVLRNYYKLSSLIHESKKLVLSPRSILLAYLKLLGGKEISEIIAMFAEQGHAPKPLTTDELSFLVNIEWRQQILPEWAQGNIPEFIWSEFIKAFDSQALAEAQSLTKEATVDLRVNLLKAKRDFVFQALLKEGINCSKTPYSPLGIRIEKRVNLENNPLYQEGFFEIQDEGSQLISLLCDVSSDHSVLDYCAGAGGKTLTLSMLMNNQGIIDAFDISYDRLQKAQVRAQRAGCKNIRFLIQKPSHLYQRVLVDAPCSGIGTWRRHPDWRVKISSHTINHLIALQQDILNKAAQCVETKGRLIYSTCSILPQENEEAVYTFLKRNSHFEIFSINSIWTNFMQEPEITKGPFLRLTPHQHGTDGFFVAILERH